MAKQLPSTERAASVDVDAVLDQYRRWLGRQPLGDRSRDAYRLLVSGFLGWLGGSEHGPAALSDPKVRDWAVRDYKRHVKTVRKWAPTTVNQALAALHNFYRSLELGRPDVAREDLPQMAPRGLDADEQRRFLRSVEADPSARDRAIATVFFYTGLRLAELSALDVEDVSISARRGLTRVRSGKGDAFREVPLNSACRSALNDWFPERTRRLAALSAEKRSSAGTALWVSRTGGRMSSRSRPGAEQPREPLARRPPLGGLPGDRPRDHRHLAARPVRGLGPRPVPPLSGGHDRGHPVHQVPVVVPAPGHLEPHGEELLRPLAQLRIPLPQLRLGQAVEVSLPVGTNESAAYRAVIDQVGDALAEVRWQSIAARDVAERGMPLEVLGGRSAPGPDDPGDGGSALPREGDVAAADAEASTAPPSPQPDRDASAWGDGDDEGALLDWYGIQRADRGMVRE